MRNRIIVFMLIIMFVIMVYVPNVYAGSAWKYTWDNTSITIPVGESYDKYKNLPIATLYRDGVPLTDANITYNTEGDWLYYSKNINTSRVGTYKVWYKAYESKYIPGTCTDYKCLVTFYVKDLINPVISAINDEVNIERNTEYDPMNNIVVTDNYSSNVRVEFSGNTKFDTIGSYKIEAKAVDESGNASKCSFTVNVFDNSKPAIEALSGDDINVPLNGTFDIKANFKATDLYDGDISNKIVFPQFKPDTVGDFDYKISVSNSAGNSTEYNGTIHVIDDVEPKIILGTSNVILDYKTDFTSFDFKNYISKIEDNNSIDYNNLKITHDILNKVGSYTVRYEYNDGNYQVSENLNVSLVSHEAPKIKVEDITLDLDSYVDLEDYITIIDESDTNIYDSLEIDDSEVEYGTEGTYYASAYCINSSGLSTEKRIRINIKGTTTYTEEHKSYSTTTIVLIAIIGLLVIINITFIIFSRKSKITSNKNDLNI